MSKSFYALFLKYNALLHETELALSPPQVHAWPLRAAMRLGGFGRRLFLLLSVVL